MEQTALEWLASKADAQILFMTSAGILVGVEVLKRLAGWLWPASKEFNGWWLVGAGVGAVLGLGLVERTTGGAMVGLVCGVLATGGFEYLGHALRFLPALRKPASILLALGVSIALCTGGCGAHAFMVEAQETQLKVLQQVEVGVQEYDRAARLELLNAETDALEAMRDGLVADFKAAASGGWAEKSEADIQATVDAIVAEYADQVASNAAERQVLDERRRRLREVIGLGRTAATRAAEIEIRRYTAAEALREQLTELVRRRAADSAEE